MTKQIPLTQGKFATVDDDMYDYLMRWKWYALQHRNTFYAIRNQYTPFRKQIRMHRLIMNTPTELSVDHVDGNGLNNTRTNLRNCTVGENNHNRKKPKNNTSGYKGVTWYRRYQKWLAQIHVNGKKLHLGYFENPIDAAHAHDKAAKKHFGEFANTNF